MISRHGSVLCQHQTVLNHPRQAQLNENLSPKYVARKTFCRLVCLMFAFTTDYFVKMPAAGKVQYILRNMHTVFALLCFVVVIHWLIFQNPPGLLHWHCGNLTIVPVPAKQPWWIWINTSCEFIMNDCITTTRQSTTKPCAYFLGYTVATNTPWSANTKISFKVICL